MKATPGYLLGCAIFIAGCGLRLHINIKSQPSEPVMRSQCAVGKINTEHRWIEFYAPEDKAEEFTKFGYLDPNQISPERFTLSVDARYDLEEVATYISHCGDQSD